MDGLRLQQIKAAPLGVETATTQTLSTLLTQNSRPSGGKEIATTRVAGARPQVRATNSRSTLPRPSPRRRNIISAAHWVHSSLLLAGRTGRYKVDFL
jgi:hypothetical protein